MAYDHCEFACGALCFAFYMWYIYGTRSTHTHADDTWIRGLPSQHLEQIFDNTLNNGMAIEDRAFLHVAANYISL